jgi:hypothetical protein
MHNFHHNERARARREAANTSLDAEGERVAARQLAQRGNRPDRVELRNLVCLMDILPAEQREVLLLAAVEELRCEELSAVLAIPIGTVMSRIPRARDKLRHTASGKFVRPIAGAVIRPSCRSGHPPSREQSWWTLGRRPLECVRPMGFVAAPDAVPCEPQGCSPGIQRGSCR